MIKQNIISRSRANSSTDFIDSPGKKYPRLCVLLLALFLFSFISWLPFLSTKPKGIDHHYCMDNCCNICDIQSWKEQDLQYQCLQVLCHCTFILKA